MQCTWNIYESQTLHKRMHLSRTGTESIKLLLPHVKNICICDELRDIAARHPHSCLLPTSSRTDERPGKVWKLAGQDKYINYLKSKRKNAWCKHWSATKTLMHYLYWSSHKLKTQHCMATWRKLTPSQPDLVQYQTVCYL